MGRSQHSSVRIPWEIMPQLVEKIWVSIGTRKKNYEWKIADQTTLKALISEEDFEILMSIQNSAHKNKKLRHILSRNFMTKNLPLKRETAKWIVASWGGIRKNAENVSDWAEEVLVFDDNNINKFILEMDTERISSWSKVFAFYDAANHAIYDSRVTIAINIVLEELKIQSLFYIPQAQSSDVNRLAQHLRSMCRVALRTDP